MVELYGEPPRKAALFVNGKARRGEEWFERSRERLLDLGIVLTTAELSESAYEMRDSVSEQIKAETPMIIIGGGDGTMSSIAHFFANRDTVLGVLPLGTGNAFARDLGIAAEVERACDVIVNGKVAGVDMGTIGDRQFLNVATLGLTTRIAEGLSGPMKKTFGKAVYILSVLQALSKVRPFLVKLQLPQGLETFECLQLVIGNGRFHAGPFPVAPDATITGGFLAIYALATRDKRAFVKMAAHMVNGHHVDLCEVKYFRAKSGIVDTVPSQELIVDGEISFRTPKEFSMAERALNVVVPQEFHG